MHRSRRFVPAVVAGLLLSPLAEPTRGQAAAETSPHLGRLVESLSETGGYFDTDNLVSNEASYARLVGKLEAVGGAYVGVGPEQNFNYIARTRPEWAFIVDVRRDNMIHVLLLIALLSEAQTPADYLELLFSRDIEIDPSSDLKSAVRAIASANSTGADFERNLTRLKKTLVTDFAVELPEAEWERLARFYRTYFEAGLNLSFTSHGGNGWGRYPSYRELALARTPNDQPAHFLASNDDYQFLRGLALNGRLVPVVGDFAGEEALRAVGSFLRDHNEKVTTFYTSNVEFYLGRSGSFADWVDNVRSLPRDDDATFIRAYFDYGQRHPQSVPGYRSTMVRQHISTFLELWDNGELRSYWDVCVRGALP